MRATSHFSPSLHSPFCKYLSQTASKQNARKILYLSGHEGADYVRDMLLHGLKEVMAERGGVVVDFVKPPHLYDIGEDTPPNGWTNENIYGLGYSTAHRLTEHDDDLSRVDRFDLSKRIRDREFDLVVYGSVHRGMLFLDEVLQHYRGENEIVFVDGEDSHGFCEKARKYAGVGVYFMREIPDHCDGWL